jgi:hypothetical protein
MKIPRPEEERRELLRRIARSGKASTRGTGRVSEEFWNLLRPEDSEGLLLKALLKDRRQGR